MAKEIRGVLGEKLGMTQVFDESNRIVPVTVVARQAHASSLWYAHRTPTATRAVQLAYGQVDPQGEQTVDGPLRQGGRDAAPLHRRAAYRRRERVHTRPGAGSGRVRSRASSWMWSGRARARVSPA